MTDFDKIQQEKEVVWQCEQSRKDIGSLEVKIERIADSLGRVVNVLRSHPELVREVPPLNAAIDIRDDMKCVDKELIFSACLELSQAKERLRISEKQLSRIRLGSPQKRIDIGEDEDQADIT
jgi:hypothetical protein